MQTKKEKSSSKDNLAIEIAKAFGEEHRTDLYRHVLHKYDETTIKRAFQEATKVPSEKIKKSKSALFFFLLNKYAE